jgi:lipopolysaccharide transport system permease protein
MSDLPVHIYSPEPLLGHPAKMLRAMFGDFWAGRELAWRLFTRDLSAQYRQTVLGYLWVFLPPLVAAMTFVFLNAQGIVQIKGTGIPYPAFAMMGTLLWQGFVDAMQAPSQAIAKARPMLAKINFPREAILLAGAYLVFFNFLVRLVILAAVMAWWKIVPNAGVVWFLPAIASLLACGFAIGIVLAPIGSLYGDVGRAIPIFAQFWMLLTPVLYPPTMSGLAGLLVRWNPASSLIVTARESLTGQPFTELAIFFLVGGLSIVVLLAGCLGFRMAMPHLIARMGG